MHVWITTWVGKDRQAVQILLDNICFIFVLTLFSTTPPPPGTNEGTISITEGELLYVIEEDKGDGWTRVRRNEEEEGYVPTSYVEVFLDNNTKGFMTYI